MAYTREFIDRVKKAYPTSERMHELAESGNEFLGRYLCDSAPQGVGYKDVLAATSLDELKAKAMLVKEKNELYCDFVDGNCFEKQPALNPDVELHIRVKNAFEKLPDRILKSSIDAASFASYGKRTVANPNGVKEFAELRDFMAHHGFGYHDREFEECFFNVQQDWVRNHRQVFNLNAFVVDDDGFTGKVVAYNPEANMYKIEHELVNGRLPVADGWYPPERLRRAVENTKSAVQLSNAGGLDSLIATARAISEQGKGLAEDLGKFKESYVME